jgi:hypothetical protein
MDDEQVNRQSEAVATSRRIQQTSGVPQRKARNAKMFWNEFVPQRYEVCAGESRLFLGQAADILRRICPISAAVPFFSWNLPAGLVPAIHVVLVTLKNVDARHKPGMTNGWRRRGQYGEIKKPRAAARLLQFSSELSCR